MLAAGTRIGSYEIVGSLGAGGMGEVYRARDSRLGREVALKVLPPEVTNEAGRLERFDREARAIAALNHPHIVTLYSTEEADGIRFLTMELVEGETLGGSIVSGGLPIGRFLEIAIPLADAITAAHQKQITHRDLKPGNVMISHDGRVKVLDFGLARVGGSDGADHTMAATQAPITAHGVIVGTMPYMSPEQVEGRALDPRSDLFSLGVIFYELLSGERPFKGGSSPALMSAILRDTPPTVCEKRSDLPDALGRLIGRMLEKQPADRIQTARDVYNELRQVQKQQDSGTRAPAGPGRVSPSVAVLPFTDLSEKKDHDWFCDGIAEEILNALSPLPGLRVAARASAFSLRGKADDLRAIGDKLAVNSVLTGSVRRSGDRVRITAQLSDVEHGQQLWSERFDRELKDIFDVQDEIARAIVARLKVTFDSDSRLVPKATASVEAYELLLKGRVLLMRRGPAIMSALPYFEQAIAIDPGLAEAHAMLGDTYRLMGLYGLRPAVEVLPLARAAAERALAIDRNQVEALATLANISSIYDWDLEATATLSARALACDPSHVRTLAERAISHAVIETPTNELRKAVLDDIAKARALDPLNAWVMAIEAFCLALLGPPEAAVAAARRAVATDEGNFTARWALVSALAMSGRDDEAREEAVPALAMSGRHPRMLSELARIHADHGEHEAAEAIHAELSSRSRTSFVGFGERAIAAAWAGHWDEARQLLAQAIAGREPYLTFWRLPVWRAIREDAESAALLRGTPLLPRDS